jgi:hypothetical protein
MSGEVYGSVAIIEEAFADAPRPPNDALLHPACADDMDIVHLYDIAHWRDLGGDDVIGGYASLGFLSAAGFRHFLPAYLLWVLRHPDSPEAVVDSTVWSLCPSVAPADLRDFVRSKYELLDDAQRRAVVVFLEAMADHPDAAAALAEWR